MNDAYLASGGGRMANAMLGFAILGAGVLALLGPGPHVTAYTALITLVCIVAGLFTVGLSTQGHWTKALTLLLALPLLAGVYLFALPYVATIGVPAGLLLVALGAAPLALALAGNSRTALRSYRAELRSGR